MKDNYSNIVVYDDLCVLCTWSIKFIAKKDLHKKFYFASLRDPEIKNYLIKNLETIDTDNESVILINKEGIYFYSDAAIRIASQLSSHWSVLKYFLFVPKIFRDSIYKIVAKYRYRIWGKLDSCWLPDESAKHRFEYGDVLSKMEKI